MEAPLNTSGQSNYHSCRQSLENGSGEVHEEKVSPTPKGGEGDSTFTFSKDTSLVTSPTDGDESDFGQSAAIAESTRTSFMNGSADYDDSISNDHQTPLQSKLTGGVSHVTNNEVENISSQTNSQMNECLMESELGCSTVDPSLTSASESTTEVKNDESKIVGESPETEGNNNEAKIEAELNNDHNDDDDEFVDVENAARQNRSGSFTIVRDKVIPGTPVIEDEAIELFNGDGRCATPPQDGKSPGLMQDSASRPLIPKAKNRRSVWGGDVFSPTCLSNLNDRPSSGK